MGKLMSHGNNIHYDGTLKKYRINSTNEVIKDDLSNLKCPKCDRPPLSDGKNNGPESEIYDACIGKLKGVKFACCCGHGIKGDRYVMLENGKCLYGDDLDLDKYKK